MTDTKAQLEFTGDGSNSTFTLNFQDGYIDASYITCRVGEEVDGTGSPAYRNITWTSETVVTIDGDVPAVGESVVFKRTTPDDAMLVEFSGGSNFTSANVDLGNRQLLHVLHELQDVSYTFEEADDILDSVSGIADQAISVRDIVLQASAAAGPYNPYATKADLNSVAGSLVEGTLVEVVADESTGGLTTRYSVGSGGALTLLSVNGRYKRNATVMAYLATVHADGEVVRVNGLEYVKDVTATGEDSCTQDLGVDGWVPGKDATFRHYGIDPTGTTDDGDKFVRAVRRGGHISGFKGDIHNLGTAILNITTDNPCQIDWNFSVNRTNMESVTETGYEDVNQFDAVVFFKGTVAETLKNCYSKNGIWYYVRGDGRIPKAHRCVRTEDMHISGHTVYGMQVDFWTHHEDAPMATSGVQRPDVWADLTNYCNVRGYSGYNIGVGDDTKDPTSDSMVGIMTRMRWIVGTATCENSTARYYRQGFTFRGGASDQDDDGNITDANGDYTPFWCQVRIRNCHAEYIERGGIWSTNAIIDVSDCYTYLCGDFGIHNEGGEANIVNCYIKDCASGIGQFSYARSTSYIGCTVLMTDHTIWNNRKLFSHVNNITGRTGVGVIRDCKFINADVTAGVANTVGVVSLERDHVWTLQGNTYWNTVIDADGTNQGKRMIDGETMYFREDFTALDGFTAIKVGGVVTDGADSAHVKNCLIEMSEANLPDGCEGIRVQAGSDAQFWVEGNRVITGSNDLTWEIVCADTASGGTKSFYISNNVLSDGTIGCDSTNNRLLCLMVTDNNVLTTGLPVDGSGTPVLGVYRVGTKGYYSNPVSAGAVGWVVTTAGGAYSSNYSASSAYSHPVQVRHSGSIYVSKTDVPADASGDNSPTGTNSGTYWKKITGSPVEFTDFSPVS